MCKFFVLVKRHLTSKNCLISNNNKKKQEIQVLGNTCIYHQFIIITNGNAYMYY